MIRSWCLIVLLLLGACSDASSDGGAQLLRAVRHPDTQGLEESVRRSVEKALAQWRTSIQNATTPAGEAAAYAELAKTYLAHHFYAPAADAFAIAGKLTSAPPKWHYLEAVALRESHQLEAALQAFQAALSLGPIGNASYYCAELLVALGDMQGARITLEAAPDEPVSQSARYALAGRIAQAQTRYLDAEKHYRQALKLQAEARALNVPLAQVVHRQSRQAEARTILRRAGSGAVTVADPLLDEISALARGVEFYVERGQTFMRQRKFTSAASDFATAVDLNPGKAMARLSLGRALEILGDIDGARLHYSQALKTQHDFPVAHYFFGSFLERQGQHLAARDHYATAVEQDADYLPPRLLLAHTFFRAGDFASAKDHYLAITERHERHVQARFYLALASLVQHDCETAVTALREASKVNPKDATIQEVLARVYTACSDRDDELKLAREIGERLNDSRPDSAAAQTLAMAFAAHQEFERAVNYQMLALQRAADNSQSFMQDALLRYQSEQPANTDWVFSDPTFVPPRLTANKPP